MDKKATYIIGLLVIAAVTFFIVISFQKNSLREDISDPETTYDAASTTEWVNTPAVVVDPKTVITAKHAFRNKQHIVAGEVPLPTPCDVLETGTVVDKEKNHILIQFKSSVKTGEMCAQQITTVRFKVTVPGAQNATFSATFNGQEVTLNLIEAGPTEDLDDFELYIKG